MAERRPKKVDVILGGKVAGSVSGLAKSWILSNSGHADGVINICVSYH